MRISLAGPTRDAGERVQERTLSGSVRKCTAIGRPLQPVSNNSCGSRAERVAAQSAASPDEGAGAGHSRFVLCLLQALQELQAVGRRRLRRL